MCTHERGSVTPNIFAKLWKSRQICRIFYLSIFRQLLSVICSGSTTGGGGNTFWGGTVGFCGTFWTVGFEVDVLKVVGFGAIETALFGKLMAVVDAIGFGAVSGKILTVALLPVIGHTSRCNSMEAGTSGSSTCSPSNSSKFTSFLGNSQFLKFSKIPPWPASQSPCPQLSDGQRGKQRFRMDSLIRRHCGCQSCQASCD